MGGHRSNSSKRRDETSESDTSFNKMGVGQQSIRTEDEQSDVHFKLDDDMQSMNSHIFNEDELQEYEESIQ